MAVRRTDAEAPLPARIGSLSVVGIGISLGAHATVEALECIRSAETVFYLVTDPASEAWLRQLNANAVTLANCYAEGKPRRDTYQEMTDRILAAVRAGGRVCAAFYGHPGVFVRPSHAAIEAARREGFQARMLPGISAEDCLFADLGVDPGRSGCQSFEATDFLACARTFDSRSALVLWQVGVLGEPSVRRELTCRPDRLQVLVGRLLRHYDAAHPVVLYEAAQFPMCVPRIIRTVLERLGLETITATTSLYIPPKPSSVVDSSVVDWFDEP